MKISSDIDAVPPRGVRAPVDGGFLSTGANSIRMKGVKSTKMHAFEARMEAETTLRITINGVIGEDVTSAQVELAIEEAVLAELVIIRINSVGGNALEGANIYGVVEDAIRRGLEVQIEVGAACMSAATLVSCAGSHVLTAPESLWMFHNPAVEADGEARDLRAVADELDKVKAQAMTIYLKRNPTMSKDEISTMLDDVTWLSGEEAVAAGWAHGLLTTTAVNAVMGLDKVKLSTLRKAGKGIQSRLKALKARMEEIEAGEEEPEKPVAKAKASAEDDQPDMAAFKASMDAMVDTVDTLAEQVDAIVEAIEQITETVAEVAEIDPEEVVDPGTLEAAAGDDSDIDTDTEEPAVDMKSPRVIAMRSLAAADGRTKEFDLAVAAGANLSGLRARFVNNQAAGKGGSSAALPGGGDIKGRAAGRTQLKTNDYYALRRGVKK